MEDLLIILALPVALVLAYLVYKYLTTEVEEEPTTTPSVKKKTKSKVIKMELKKGNAYFIESRTQEYEDRFVYKNEIEMGGHIFLCFESDGTEFALHPTNIVRISPHGDDE